MAESAVQNERITIRSLLPKYDFYLVVLYGLIMASAYLWAFWSRFGINPFEYMRFQDIPMLALYGLLPVLWAVPVFLGVGAKVISRAGLDGDARARAARMPFYIGFLAGAATAVAFLFWIDPKGVTVVLVTTVFAFTVGRWLSMAVFHQVRAAHRLIFGLAIALPPILAFMTGFSRGEAVVEGQATRLAEVRFDNGDVLPPLAGRTHFLGHLGTHDFFFTFPSKAVIRVSSESITRMQTTRIEVCAIFCSLTPAGELIDKRFWRQWFHRTKSSADRTSDQGGN